MSKRRSGGKIRFSHIFGLILLAIILLLVREIARKPEPVPPPETLPPGVHVLDGDTFTDSEGNTVRLLGIDTPEKGQPFAKEAEVELQRLLNSAAQIRYEFGKEKTDRYQRLLAFVFADSIFVNERLLEDGLATAYFFEGQLASAAIQELCAAQRAALRAKIGIWTLTPEPLESVYYGNTERRRFHRPSCSAVESGEMKHLVKRSTREEFLNDCYSPCRNCKP